MHLVEGAALAVLATGVEAITSGKVALELNFNAVWRRWAQAAVFPSIAGHDPGNLFWFGVGKSARRRGVRAAWRDNGPWLEPYIALAGDWGVEECLEMHADERVSVADWKEFGRLYVARFEPDELRLAGQSDRSDRVADQDVDDL